MLNGKEILKIIPCASIKNDNIHEIFKNYFKTNKDSQKYKTRHKYGCKLYKSNKKLGDNMLKNIGARLCNNFLSALV